MQNKYFIAFLRKYISPTVSWDDIAVKCIDQNDEYCLKLIKAKSWTDKSTAGGSWSEKLESLIVERIMLSITHITLWTKSNDVDLNAYILKHDHKGISPFTIKLLNLIDENIIQILSLYGIQYKYLTPETVSNLAEDCIYIMHNRITWTKNTEIIPFKRSCIIYPIVDTPITPQMGYIANADCINAGIMVWEYLIDDEFRFPGRCPYAPAKSHRGSRLRCCPSCRMPRA